MKIKDSLLLVPFRLLFLILQKMLKKMSRFILKNEIKEKQDFFSVLHKKNDVLKKEKENIFTENNALRARFNRFREIIKDNRNKTYELAITKNNELVVISYSKKEIFDTIELFGESGNNKDWDSEIEFLKRGEKIHITSFMSKIKGKGYGRVLMDFVLKNAVEQKYTSITGELSSSYSDNFNLLIPFYKSFGFECTLCESDEKIIVGKIELNLKKGTDTIL
jgi:GNAT superfamily N-acetyltransferase